MYNVQKSKNCKNYRSMERDLTLGYHNNKSLNVNCQSCVYFSARNCGMDTAIDTDPRIEFI